MMNLKKLRVPTPSDDEKIMYHDGGTDDIIKVILHADAQFRKSDLVGDVPTVLKSNDEYETLYNIWDFVKYEHTYKTDKAGFEKVKAPNWLLYNKVGDCKSYSVLTAAILKKLGFRYQYRFVGFDSDRANPTHVYIVAHMSNGQSVILDSVHTTFDSEPRHTFQFDKKPSQNGISGIRL